MMDGNSGTHTQRKKKHGGEGGGGGEGEKNAKDRICRGPRRGNNNAGKQKEAWANQECQARRLLICQRRPLFSVMWCLFPLSFHRQATERTNSIIFYKNLLLCQLFCTILKETTLLHKTKKLEKGGLVTLGVANRVKQCTSFLSVIIESLQFWQSLDQVT